MSPADLGNEGDGYNFDRLGSAFRPYTSEDPNHDASNMPSGIRKLTRWGLLYWDVEDGFQPTALFDTITIIAGIIDGLLEMVFAVLLGALAGYVATLCRLNELFPSFAEGVPLWKLGALISFVGHTFRFFIRPSIVTKTVISAMNRTASLK